MNLLPRFQKALHQALEGLVGKEGLQVAYGAAEPVPVESGADPGAELIVAYRGHLAVGDGGNRAQ